LAISLAADSAAYAASLAPAPRPTWSSDPQEALFQILRYVGIPGKQNDLSSPSLTWDPAELLAKADPQTVRELALLGMFGEVGSYEGVDYSLREKYYQPVGTPPGHGRGGQNWAPKDPYEAIWADYMAGKAPA